MTLQFSFSVEKTAQLGKIEDKQLKKSQLIGNHIEEMIWANYYDQKPVLLYQMWCLLALQERTENWPCELLCRFHKYRLQYIYNMYDIHSGNLT